MITVYELERRVTSYYGLCGLKMEKAIYVRCWAQMPDPHRSTLSHLKDAGWKLKRERVFPTKLKTGGFTRRIN